MAAGRPAWFALFNDSSWPVDESLLIGVAAERQEAERAQQLLETCRDVLSEGSKQFGDELTLLARIIRMSASQHRGSVHFRRMQQLLSVCRKLSCNDLPSFITAAAELTNDDPLKGKITQPSHQLLELLCVRIVSIGVMCRRGTRACGLLYLALQEQLRRTYFMPLALTGMSMASRIYVLLKNRLQALSDLHSRLQGVKKTTMSLPASGGVGSILGLLAEGGWEEGFEECLGELEGLLGGHAEELVCLFGEPRLGGRVGDVRDLGEELSAGGGGGDDEGMVLVVRKQKDDKSQRKGLDRRGGDQGRRGEKDTNGDYGRHGEKERGGDQGDEGVTERRGKGGMGGDEGGDWMGEGRIEAGDTTIDDDGDVMETETTHKGFAKNLTPTSQTHKTLQPNTQSQTEHGVKTKKTKKGKHGGGRAADMFARLMAEREQQTPTPAKGDLAQQTLAHTQQPRPGADKVPKKDVSVKHSSPASVGKTSLQSSAGAPGVNVGLVKKRKSDGAQDQDQSARPSKKVKLDGPQGGQGNSKQIEGKGLVSGAASSSMLDAKKQKVEGGQMEVTARGVVGQKGHLKQSVAKGCGKEKVKSIFQDLLPSSDDW